MLLSLFYTVLIFVQIYVNYDNVVVVVVVVVADDDNDDDTVTVSSSRAGHVVQLGTSQDDTGRHLHLFTQIHSSRTH